MNCKWKWNWKLINFRLSFGIWLKKIGQNFQNLTEFATRAVALGPGQNWLGLAILCGKWYLLFYRKTVTGSDAVKVLVATKAKASKDANSSLDKEYFKHFLEVQLKLDQFLKTIYTIFLFVSKPNFW